MKYTQTRPECQADSIPYDLGGAEKPCPRAASFNASVRPPGSVVDPFVIGAPVCETHADHLLRAFVSEVQIQSLPMVPRCEHQYLGGLSCRDPQAYAVTTSLDDGTAETKRYCPNHLMTTLDDLEGHRATVEKI